MSRGFSFIALLLLGIVAFGLYQLSYEVQRLEDELVELNRALGQERETIGVLQAEWSYLARPEYLQDKAQRLLDMKPATARQITRIEDLPWRQERIAPPPVAMPTQPAPAAVAAAPQAPVQQAPVQAPQTQAPQTLAVAQPVAAKQAATLDDMDGDVAAVLGAMRGGSDRPADDRKRGAR
ncbi:cell division protein FtsL [Ferrovibrio sp.]|uniref:cell division protein FtsL n=1 Tax=Ferrovibrio sp. TaxID=1917215 RepID=UPI003D27C94D